MVAREKPVRPGAGSLERVVLDDDGTVEHRLLLSIALQALVRLRPDALAVVHLAEAVAGAAAGAVALVLRAHRLRADVGDIGERAVAAVLAPKQRRLRRLLDDVQGPVD